MQKPLPHMVFPTLPRDKRAYDLDHQMQLQAWTSQVTQQSQFQGVGEVLASGVTLKVSHAIHHVTGTNTVQNLQGPPDTIGDVTLIADGAFTLGAGGNITGALPRTTVVGGAYRLTFDGKKWALH